MKDLYFISRCSEEKKTPPLPLTTNSLVSEMEVPKDQIATLMEHGLYDSAEMLVTSQAFQLVLFLSLSLLKSLVFSKN